MPKKEQQATAKPHRIKTEAAEVEVSATVLGTKQPASKKKLRVRPFVTEPARVDYGIGHWFPTGDFAGVRIDVRISAPCYPQELKDMFEQCRDMAEELLEREVERLAPGEGK